MCGQPLWKTASQAGSSSDMARPTTLCTAVAEGALRAIGNEAATIRTLQISPGQPGCIRTTAAANPPIRLGPIVAVCRGSRNFGGDSHSLS